MGSGTLKTILGSGESRRTTINTAAPPTEEEKQLIAINTELAKKQLANVDAMAPFQKELLDLSIADLRRQGVETAALDAAITPEQRATAAKSDFERSQRLGPMQDELMQMQLEELRRGGAATPEQLARIKEATDLGIEAGSADIDISTQRGIGLISDELANSRGLRLTDSPIMNEAGYLAQSGQDQKASLIKNLRASQAQAALNYPLAVQSLQSGINLNQQGVAQNAAQFQADLRARAQMNRLALTGQASGSGIGLAGLGAGVGASSLHSLTGARSNTQYQTGFDPSARMNAAGNMMQGIGSIMGGMSDRRLKRDYGVVAKTDSGIDLHVYRYKWEDDSDPLRLGVMAQDVEKVKPEAVFTHRSGYKGVDYARL